MKMRNFLGDLTDISAKTKPLAAGECPTGWMPVPGMQGVLPANPEEYPTSATMYLRLEPVMRVSARKHGAIFPEDMNPDDYDWKRDPVLQVCSVSLRTATRVSI